MQGNNLKIDLILISCIQIVLITKPHGRVAIKL